MWFCITTARFAGQTFERSCLLCACRSCLVNVWDVTTDMFCSPPGVLHFSNSPQNYFWKDVASRYIHRTPTSNLLNSPTFFFKTYNQTGLNIWRWGKVTEVEPSTSGAQLHQRLFQPKICKVDFFVCFYCYTVY